MASSPRRSRANSGLDPNENGGVFVGGVEVRSVPSKAFPTLAAALSHLGSSGTPNPPNVVVRLLPGTYECDRLSIVTSVVIEGSQSGSLPTIRCGGTDGLRIAGTAAAGCALRRLRLCAEMGCSALTIHDATPLIESCEVLGAGGEASRGTPAGLVVKGARAWPVIRKCLISAHSGPGICFRDDSSGMVANSEISKCGCGVWLEEGGNPILWRNTVSGQRGAGIVVKADGAGSAVGNSILQNGAAGLLIESSRYVMTVMVKNRVWGNRGQDLRQSPAPAGHTAAESGALLLNNHIGKRENTGSSDPGSAMSSAWPRRVVRNDAELRAALSDAPRDRTVVVEISGSIQLEDRLVINRPVVLAGTAPGSAEIRGAPGVESAITIGRGGEASAFRWLSIRLQQGQSVSRAGGSCVDISAGRPTFVECDFNATSQAQGNRATLSSERTLLTHAVRVSGQGVAPLLAGCILRGASGVGLLADRGGVVTLIQCELSRNRQGGCYLGDGASLASEECKINGNGHFGAVVGPSAGSMYLGRTQLAGNMAGSVWHCGHGSNVDGEGNAHVGKPCLIWLDQCSLAGPGTHAGNSAAGSAGPAVVVGPAASAVFWESSLLKDHQHSVNPQDGDSRERNGPNGTNGKLMMVRLEATARAAIASDGPLGGWPGWSAASSDKPGKNINAGVASLVSGVGSAVMLDVSGAAPPVPPPPPSPKTAPIAPPSYSEKLWRSWEVPPPPPVRGMPQSPMQSHAAPRPPPPQPLQRAGTAPSQTGVRKDSGHGMRSAPTSPQLKPAAPQMAKSKSMAAPPGRPEEKSGGKSLPDVGLRVEKLMSTQGESFMTANSPMDDTDRITLYQVLAMLVVKYKCKEALDVAGLGGLLRPKDTVYFRGHTGRWIVAKDSGEVVCNATDRESATAFVLDAAGRVDGSGNLQHGNAITLLATKKDGSMTSQQLGVTGGEVRLLPKGGTDCQWVVDVESATKKFYSGTPLFLKGKGNQKNLDVQTEIVSARFEAKGTLQRISLDKLPPPSEVPEPAPERDFSQEEVAWLFLRGAQFALLDRQPLAAALGNHKGPAKDLLKLYTTLWKEEWKSTVPADMFSGGGTTARRSRGESDMTRTSTTKSGRSKSPSTWLGKLTAGVIEGGGSPIDSTNGDLFMMALRSYFATAIRMSQLEADCVQRVVEAFAGALAGDPDFIKSFSQSMLPEKDRKVYVSEDDVVFGLTYMTIMLNTDAHNSQVTEKTWDYKRFVASGKDCGVTGGLMAQVFKLIAAEEL
mmetsp:Transcript_40566/g.95357  ORF Transcript_40566/g.95357 Transcript_40566/m.95357 type:complete len:1264 (+) Transcript_40566:129-3920(+)